jgi:hypothetical protein
MESALNMKPPRWGERGGEPGESERRLAGRLASKGVLSHDSRLI